MYRLVSFRLIIAFNLILIALSWSPLFEGTETKVGAVDHLLGAFRLGGFRADVIWLVVSTAGVFLALIVFLIEARRSRTARINALLCVTEILAFCSFIYRILTTGVLDFG
jgi:hypothetical protein